MEDKNFKTSDLGNLLDRPSPHHLRRITHKALERKPTRWLQASPAWILAITSPGSRYCPIFPPRLSREHHSIPRAAVDHPVTPLTLMHVCECVSDLTDCVLSLSRRACRP